jgi:hypothetical protein
LKLSPGGSQDTVTPGATQRVPESTPMISATDASTRVTRPAVGSLDSGHIAGHIEM